MRLQLPATSIPDNASSQKRLVRAETTVRHNAVQPGIKTAFESEAVQIAVNLQESFLIDVPCILGPLHQIQRQPQHVAVESAHQFLESRAVSGLSLDDEGPFVKFRQGGHRGQYGVCSAGPACVSSHIPYPIQRMAAAICFRISISKPPCPRLLCGCKGFLE